jgi:catechol 2,3-dioxygenase-like lactoylglutathione lyase family enzyme
MPVRRLMLDHITIGVSDLQRSREFYERVLAPLGFQEAHTADVLPNEVEFGPDGLTDFAISTDYPVGAPIHVAFAADSREQRCWALQLLCNARAGGPGAISLCRLRRLCHRR